MDEHEDGILSKTWVWPYIWGAFLCVSFREASQFPGPKWRLGLLCLKSFSSLEAWPRKNGKLRTQLPNTTQHGNMGICPQFGVAYFFEKMKLIWRKHETFVWRLLKHFKFVTPICETTNLTSAFQGSKVYAYRTSARSWLWRYFGYLQLLSSTNHQPKNE